jgi:hypothetical protein
VPQFQTRQELDAWWKQWQNQYAQDNPFSVKSSGALGNYQYDLTQFAVNQAGRAIDLQQAAANARPKQEAERKPALPAQCLGCRLLLLPLQLQPIRHHP